MARRGISEAEMGDPLACEQGHKRRSPNHPIWRNELDPRAS